MPQQGTSASSQSTPSMSWVFGSPRITKKDLKRREKESIAAAEAGDMDEIYFRIKSFTDAGNELERDYWIKKAAQFGDPESALHAIRYMHLPQAEYDKYCLTAFEKGSADAVPYATEIYWRRNNWQMALALEERMAKERPHYAIRVAERYLIEGAPWYDSTLAMKMLKSGAENGDSSCIQLLQSIADPTTRPLAMWALKNEVLQVEDEQGWILGRRFSYSPPVAENTAPNFYGDYWLTDLYGKNIINRRTASIIPIRSDVLLVSNGEKEFFITGKNFQQSEEYDQIELRRDAPMRVRRQHLWGFANTDGRALSEMKYLFASPFENGISAVWDGSLCFRINTNGESIGEKKEMKLEERNSGLAVKDFPEIKVQTLRTNFINGFRFVGISTDLFPKSCPFGVIDKKGKWIVKPDYILGFYDEGISSYSISKDNQFYNCSLDGKLTPRKSLYER